MLGERSFSQVVRCGDVNTWTSDDGGFAFLLEVNDRVFFFPLSSALHEHVCVSLSDKSAATCFALLSSSNWRLLRPPLLAFKKHCRLCRWTLVCICKFFEQTSSSREKRGIFSAIACRTAFACPRLREGMSHLCGVLAHISRL